MNYLVQVLKEASFVAKTWNSKLAFLRSRPIVCKLSFETTRDWDSSL